ncbi:hypothetical protein B0T25DRAFT_86336 [Lasiosphaeria hispida]|uniref:Uncharacterized protein n=1 Tax=Lasiosphaeria hispida TaxID=260671 RepID=A0AAJ0HPJ9_9PEZI|nr:hypothetical protein B0T25DRAFT_86336 [Lasiosphaeria hispida]
MGGFVVVQKRLGLLDVLAVLDEGRPIALGCWGVRCSEVQLGTGIDETEASEKRLGNPERCGGVCVCRPNAPAQLLFFFFLACRSQQPGARRNAKRAERSPHDENYYQSARWQTATPAKHENSWDSYAVRSVQRAGPGGLLTLTGRQGKLSIWAPADAAGSPAWATAGRIRRRSQAAKRTITGPLSASYSHFPSSATVTVPLSPNSAQKPRWSKRPAPATRPTWDFLSADSGRQEEQRRPQDPLARRSSPGTTMRRMLWDGC